ncbi:MAG: PrsW family intramembrane metalloprotease [Eubacterium sp.]|nr:PrsW family intramembrane metalloprotease [Eubacterium sp.]
MSILLCAALLPPLFLMVTIYRMDKIESEPVGLIVKLIIFGAIACIPACILEVVGINIVSGIFSPTSVIGIAITNFLVVALAEEFMKRFFLKRITWNSPEFDYRFDAVVYAVSVSLGFAALENVLYVFSGEYFSQAMSIAGTRAFISIPGHCIFGIFMGYYYGLAKYASKIGDAERERHFNRMSLFVPVILHGFFDFALSLNSSVMSVIFLIYVIIMDIIAIRSIRKYAREDEQIDPREKELF